MPAGKRQQGNGWLYAAVTFIILFVIVLVVAIIFYLKFEDQRVIAQKATSDLEDVFSKTEQRKGLGKIVAP